MNGSELFISIIALIFTGYAGASLYMVFNERRLVYSPERSIVTTPREHGFDYDAVTFRTRDGVALNGWFVPAKEARLVVLFFHGNTGNISHRMETLGILHRLGLSTFIFDYRGYGRSEGVPSEQGTYRDAEAAWEYLTSERGIAPQNVILFGRSLGGAIATWLAARSTPRALVVESSFSSLPELAQQVYPWLPVRWLARSRYDSKTQLRDIRLPLLIIHSLNDELIPFSHAQTLFEACPSDNKALVEIRGRHNDGFLLSGEAYTSGLRDFFKKLN